MGSWDVVYPWYYDGLSGSDGYGCDSVLVHVVHCEANAIAEAFCWM